MKVVFYSYLFISVCTLVAFVLTIMDVQWTIKNKHPELYAADQANKTSLSGRLLSWLSICLLSICPVFHITTISMLVLKRQEITDETIQRLKEKYFGNTECKDQAVV